MILPVQMNQISSEDNFINEQQCVSYVSEKLCIYYGPINMLVKCEACLVKTKMSL